MRRKHVLMLMLLISSLLGGLAACSSGHLGSDEIAFVRDGHLWTIDPSGANAFQVESDSMPVLGYGWSPNHQIFVYRTLDSDFAKTAAGKHIAFDPITGLGGDLPGGLNTVGLDGGSPIPILLSNPAITRSNAWWNPTGNRLLYREGSSAHLATPDLVSWWVSQNDQPAGIARKQLPNSYTIPSLSTDGTLALGDSNQGIFTTTMEGANFQFVTRGVLPGHPLGASLERVLWQPAHEKPALLYAVPASTSSAPSHSGNTALARVQLLLRQPNSQTATLATCTCTQFAWSPDGRTVLYSTGASYTLLSIVDHTSFTFAAEAGSVPYWSPDSTFLLIDGQHTLLLVQPARQSAQVLLSDGTTSGQEASSSPLPQVNAFLQPLANSLWSVDSRRFVLYTRERLLWRGQRLNTGNGLYMVTINGTGQVQGLPMLVDKGSDAQIGWSYENPDTSFLF